MRNKNNFQTVISEERYEEAAVELIKALLQEKVPLNDIQYLSGKTISEIKKIAISIGFEEKNSKN